jgi:solute carrier family 25 (mitochondrial thiamine pyrophosphate transporter), member 19
MTAKEPSSSSSDDSNDDSNSVQQQQQSQQTPYPAWHSVVAGGVAGLGSRMATAPLDFFRIRRQLNLAPDAHGIWRGLSHVYQNEGGLVALYRGNLAAIYLWIGYAACQFSVYHRVKDWLVQSSLSVSPSLIVINDDHSRAFVAGATAGSVALLVTYPLDVCRTQMVAHGILTKHLVFASLYDPQTLPKTTTTTAVEAAAPQTLTGCARTLYRSRGLAGFYAGVRPALVQIIPYMGINFALYEALSSSSPFSSSSSLDETSSVSLAAYAGSISGAVSKMIVYPLDTVKRRLQAQAFRNDNGGMILQRYDGMIDCFVRVARHEGIAGFYRGIVPSVVKTGLATSMSFAIFRWTTNLLERGHDHFVP